MTDDLISKQSIMKEFVEFVRRSNNSDFASIPTWNDAVSLVGSMPSAERKKGTWIMINDHTARCSSCKEIRWTNGHDQTMKGHIFYALYKYCPECGALMEASNDK